MDPEPLFELFTCVHVVKQYTLLQRLCNKVFRDVILHIVDGGTIHLS